MKGANFKGSSEKRYVTMNYDLPIIRNFFAKRKGLHYFGMPGAQAEDVEIWKESIARVTAFEYRSNDPQIYHNIENRLKALGVRSINVVRNSFEDTVRSELLQRWASHPLKNRHTNTPLFDIVNLDFLGGLGYKRSQSPPSRIDAIRNLFSLKTGSKFLLLVTLNVRDTILLEMKQFLRRLSRSFDSVGQAILESHISDAPGLKHLILKAVVPQFLTRVAEYHGFSAFVHPPLKYRGNRSNMVHFAVEVRPDRDSYFGGISMQTPRDLLELPLIQVANGELLISDIDQGHHLCHDFMAKLVSRLPYKVAWRRDERENDDRVDRCELEPGDRVHSSRAGM